MRKAILCDQKYAVKQRIRVQNCRKHTHERGPKCVFHCISLREETQTRSMHEPEHYTIKVGKPSIEQQGTTLKKGTKPILTTRSRFVGLVCTTGYSKSTEGFGHHETVAKHLETSTAICYTNGKNPDRME